MEDVEEEFEAVVNTPGDIAEDMVEDAEESFGTGMERAKARLRQKFNAAGISQEEDTDN